MPPIITKITSVKQCALGEGPHWDPISKSLFFVDIDGKTIHNYDPRTNVHKSATLDGCNEKVSLILPIKNKPQQFIVSSGKSLGIVIWDVQSSSASFELLVEINAGAETRINDGKCDAIGRIWFGTMTDENTFQCGLYSYHNGVTTQHLDNVSISNGLAWNKANTKFYYIDSPRQCIFQFDFDLSAGTIKNRQVLFSFAETNTSGLPDGMAIDVEDNLWVALFDGYGIIKISTREKNKLLEQIAMPAKQITSLCFAGEELNELYITSARVPDSLAGRDCGALFKITNLGDCVQGMLATEAVF